MAEHRGQDSRYDGPPTRATGKAPKRQPAAPEALEMSQALRDAHKLYGGLDVETIGRLFGRGKAPSGPDKVDLSGLELDSFEVRPFPLFLLRRACVELFGGLEEGLSALAKPSRTLLLQGRVAMGKRAMDALRTVDEWPGMHQDPHWAELAPAANFANRFEEGRALLAHLQADAELKSDEHALTFVTGPARPGAPRRRLSDPPRSWTYFRITLVATYRILAAHVEGKGYWGHSTEQARRVANAGQYNGSAMEITADIARELEPVWLGDLEPKHVRHALDWVARRQK